MSSGFQLQTERLLIREARVTDVDQMHTLVSDFEVVRHTGSWPWPACREFTVSRTEPTQCTSALNGMVFLGTDLIGTVGTSAEGEFGYMLARQHWGKGYATESGKALIAEVFRHTDWPKLSACVFADNPASSRVLEKLGFTEGPKCEGWCEARNGRFPTRTFTLTRPHT